VAAEDYMPEAEADERYEERFIRRRENRMSNLVTTIKRGKTDRRPRILIYGEPKIGKTTFAAGAKDPVFLGPEDGAPQLDIARMPAPQSWPDIESQVESLIADQQGCSTVVLDTLDALEPVLWRYICELHNKRNIEDFGYGRGYEVAIDEWRKFIRLLETLNQKMTLVVLAHAWTKTVQNAEGPDYERVELKFHKKAWPLFTEWVDVIGFATRPLKVSKDGKASGGGKHVLRTMNAPAYVAGSRWPLPDPLPLEWPAFRLALANAGAFKLPPAPPPTPTPETITTTGETVETPTTDAASSAA
jgi:hypothetical protein